MSAGFTAPPAPMPGVGHLAAWLHRDAAHRVTVLHDPAVSGQPILAAVLTQIEAAGKKPRVLPLPGPGSRDSILALAEGLDEGEPVVGVGGGSVLDQAKLAVLFRSSPEALSRVSAPQRSGMVALPPHLGASVRVIAVPTTLGTGSELSTVACVAHAEGKRLVTGPCLRPVAAILDPEATRTLPPRLVSEGVLEALFRTVSPYVGDPTDLPGPDALTEDLAARLVRAGDRISRLRADGLPIDPSTRIRVAELSGQSQAGPTNLGRDPYSVKGWLLGNELSSELGLSKMHSIAAIWPALWRRIADGDSRLGDARRLDRIWGHMRGQAPRLPSDPVRGIAELVDSWRVDRRINATPAQVDATVTRVMRAWGAGLPMLGGLYTHDVRELLTEAVSDEKSPPGRPVPPMTSASPAQSLAKR